MTLAGVPWRNALRHPGRAALTVAAVAAVVTGFLVLRATVDAFELGARQSRPERLAVRHRLSFTLTLPARYVEEIRQVPGVRAASQALWFNGRDPREPAHVFTSFAVDPASWLEVADELVLDEGARARWLADRNAVIVGAPLARRLGVEAGDTLTLDGTVYPGQHRFTVAGVFGVSRESQAARQLYLHWRRVEDALPDWRRGRMGWALVKVDDPARAGEVARAIDARFADRDARTVTISERTVYATFLGLLETVLGVLDVVTAVLAAVALLVLGGAMATAVRERTAELAVLRAIGFTPARVAGLVLAEGALLGGAGGLAGVLVALPVVELGVGRWLEDHLSGLFPEVAIGAADAALAALAAALVGGLAALAPAISSARLPTALALRLSGE
jgi:putative ABC transport system permease protein